MEAAEFQKMMDEEDRMWWYLATRKVMISYLKKYMFDTHGWVVDCGCGTGGFLKYASMELSDTHFMGIELDSWAAENARKKSTVNIVRGSVDLLPFRENAFSAAISTDVLYHKKVDDRKAVKDVYRCLQNQGVFIIQVPAYKWLSSAHDQRVFGARRYTKKQVNDLLLQAGFSIKLSTYRNSLLFPLMVIQRKILTRKGDKSDVKRYPALLEWFFSAVMKLEHIMLKIGFCFPYGGSVFAIGVKNDK